MEHQPAGDPAEGSGSEDDDDGGEEEEEEGASLPFLEGFFSLIQGNCAAGGCPSPWGALFWLQALSWPPGGGSGLGWRGGGINVESLMDEV